MEADSMTIEFSTRKYQASHGKSPKGRGQWAFENSTGEMFFTTGGAVTYTDAKKQAHKFFKIGLVFVLG